MKTSDMGVRTRLRGRSVDRKDYEVRRLIRRFRTRWARSSATAPATDHDAGASPDGVAAAGTVTGMESAEAGEARSSPVARTKLLVLFGGRSAEHDVSRVTASHVLRAVDPIR